MNCTSACVYHQETEWKIEFEKGGLLKFHKLERTAVLQIIKLAAWMKTSREVHKLLTDMGGNYPHPRDEKPSERVQLASTFINAAALLTASSFSNDRL